MKKFLAVFMCIAVLISVLGVGASAEGSVDYNGYPIVLVPGYASASLEYVDGDETFTAWGWETSDLTTDFANNALTLLRGIDLLTLGKSDFLINAVSVVLGDLLEPMECYPDGTSKRQVRPVLSKAQHTNDRYMNKNYPDGDYRVELDMTGALDKLVGEENVYYFNCDFRLSAVECAKALDEYITDVKKYSGKDKVNIIAVSHGGLITSTYLALYMDKQDVFNVVMNEPALAGAGLAADFLNNRVQLDEESLVRYLEYHSQSEVDFNWLVKSQPLDGVDEIAKKIVPKILKSVLYWGSLWDFVPLSEYEQLKSKLLDKTESAAMIAQSDFVHYQIMNKYPEIFSNAKALGINVNIIAGSGNAILTGTGENSDGIITVSSSTGAICAPIGKRFADGYVQAVKYDERMISPSMDIDASSCYLPYNTWIVNGLYHGMEFWDEYTRSLLFKLVTTNEPFDVNTFKEYPRFHDTTSVTASVSAVFNQSQQGYLGVHDTELELKNLSSKYKLMILDVRCDGTDIDFDWEYSLLSPGETATVGFECDLPKGVTYVQVKVTYFLIGSATPLNQRKQSFTVINGEDLHKGYGYNSNEFETGFEKSASKTVLKVMDKIGITDFVSIACDAASSQWKRIKDIFT